MNLPKLKMEGRSGCKLVVDYDDTQTIIKKYSSSLTYNSRLVKQAEKQQSYFNNISNGSDFSTAQVFNIYSDQDQLSYFTMPYIFAEKYSEYLDRISYLDIHSLTQKLIGYFDDAIKQSKVEEAVGEIIFSKIAQVKSTIKANAELKSQSLAFAFTFLDEQMPNMPLPIGNCHGDFTFSNIMFGDEKIYLLDFLDSFIESPLIDIVKLRQDTCYKWSIMIEGEMPKYKVNKLLQIFNFIDNAIEEYCNSLQLSEWYHYLQVINLLRIVPYLKKRHEILFIENALKQLLK